MRKVICEEEDACVLEPSNTQVGKGGVNTTNSMTGGSAGLAPEAASYMIPLKGVSRGDIGIRKRKRRSQQGGGMKKRTVKRKTTHSRKRSVRRSKTQVGAGRRRAKGKKRKCVKRKK